MNTTTKENKKKNLSSNTPSTTSTQNTPSTTSSTSSSLYYLPLEYRNEADRFKKPFVYEFDAEVSPLVGCKKLKFYQNDKAIGSTLWDGALVLCKYFEKLLLKEEDNKELLPKGKNVLELGAGVGVCGFISLLLLRPDFVLMTDLYQSCVDLMEKSIHRNFISSNKESELNSEVLKQKINEKISASILDWNSKSDVNKIFNKYGTFDIIIGAEIMYRPELSQTLLGIFKKFTKKGSVIYLSYGRNRTASESLFQLLEKESNDFKMMEIPRENHHHLFRRDIVDIVKIERI